MVKKDLLCPFCGSDNIVRKKKVSWVTLIFIFVLSFLVPIFKKSYYCFDCDREWKYDKKGNAILKKKSEKITQP